jgi:hypothetical protein
MISCSMDTRRSDDQQIIGPQVFWGSCTPAGNGFSSLFPYIDERPSGDAVTAQAMGVALGPHPPLNIELLSVTW